MPEVIPFRAFRYNPRVVPDLAEVVAPPYDVISPAAQARYHARHPYNVVRLILPTDDPAAGPAGNRYRRAAEAFAAWQRDGILERDPAPAVYLYEQEFSVGAARRLRRRGLLALVRLHDYTDGVIFPHERTFARYRDDRLQLMRACPANLEAILGFYPGPAPVVGAILDTHAARDPVMRLVDEDGVGHRVWPVRDRAEIVALAAALRDRPVIIADGHHRYETALNFRNERRTPEVVAQAAAPPSLDGFVLMNLVDAHDPGLVILPTHRVLRRLPGRTDESLGPALARHFAVQALPLDSRDPLRSLRVALADLARRPEGSIACAVYAGGPEVLILDLTDPSARQALLAEGRAPALANLDVAVLHRLVIETLWGIPASSQGDDTIQYTRDESQALAAVRGGAAAAVFLNAPRVAQVQAVAMAGDRMPQKSTFFFPKVLSGLVFNSLTRE